MKQMKLISTVRKSLFIYSAVIAVASLITQLLIAANNSQITALNSLLLAIIVLYYVYYVQLSNNGLQKVRFARLVAHVITYFIVVLSYHVHALILFAAGRNVFDDADTIGSSGWFGPLISMTTFWGLGLLVYTVSSIASRGFEAIEK